MTRIAAALVAVLACAPGARADDFSAWREGAAAAAIEGDPWRAEAGFVPDDAFIFADVPQVVRLGPDAVAVAVRADMERLARTAGDVAPRSAAGPRVAAAFERFAPIGSDGRAYASLEIARGRAGPATTAREITPQPPVLAMSLPHR